MIFENKAKKTKHLTSSFRILFLLFLLLFLKIISNLMRYAKTKRPWKDKLRIDGLQAI